MIKRRRFTQTKDGRDRYSLRDDLKLAATMRSLRIAARGPGGCNESVMDSKTVPAAQITKSLQEWRKQLMPQQYYLNGRRVLRCISIAYPGTKSLMALFIRALQSNIAKHRAQASKPAPTCRSFFGALDRVLLFASGPGLRFATAGDRAPRLR